MKQCRIKTVWRHKCQGSEILWADFFHFVNSNPPSFACFDSFVYEVEVVFPLSTWSPFHRISGMETVLGLCRRWACGYFREKYTLQGAFTPTGSGSVRGYNSVLCVGWVFTLARVREQFQFAEALFRGTGPLIYKYWSISASYSCGFPWRITQWTISAQRTSSGAKSTTPFLQTYPLRRPRAGSARFPYWCKCPLTDDIILYVVRC